MCVVRIVECVSVSYTKVVTVSASLPVDHILTIRKQLFLSHWHLRPCDQSQAVISNVYKFTDRGPVEEATDFSSTQEVVPQATSESKTVVTQIKNEPDRTESGA